MTTVREIFEELIKTTLLTPHARGKWLFDHVGPSAGTAMFLLHTLHVTAHTIACIRHLHSHACIHEHPVMYTIINTTDDADARHKWATELFLYTRWSPEDDACVPLHCTTSHERVHRRPPMHGS